MSPPPAAAAAAAEYGRWRKLYYLDQVPARPPSPTRQPQCPQLTAELGEPASVGNGGCLPAARSPPAALLWPATCAPRRQPAVGSRQRNRPL
jgi:hypothetical protein